MRRFRHRPALLALTIALSATITVAATLSLAHARQDEPKQADEKDQDKGKGKDKAKDKDEKKDAKGKGKSKRRPVAAGAPPRKGRPQAADPLNKAAVAADANPAAKAMAEAAEKARAKAQPVGPPKWPFHYKIKVAGGDGAPLAAHYYPAKVKFNAPVVMLVHDKGTGRAGKDWEEPLEDLKNLSLAEHLQEQGYSVLVPDLRYHGGNAPRREPTPAEWRAMPADLQAFYLFLVDRHNRGELNLSKLGVIADGEAANLVAAWAAMPGAAVSSEGRVSDLSALVLISPVEDAGGIKLATAIPPIAPRVPILVVCGDRDQASIAVVKAAQPVIERQIKSKVSYIDTNLHGSRLVNFFPKVPAAIARFLDDPVKGRVIEWEPRYLLTPVGYQSEGVVESASAKKADEPAAKKAPEPAARKAPEPAAKKAPE